MMSEPANKQENKNEIHQFVVLNHILFSNIAAIASSVLEKGKIEVPEKILRTANKTLSALSEGLQMLGKTEDLPTHRITQAKQETAEEMTPDNLLLEEQLEFIYKLGVDIKKTTASIIA
jgi:hypothetical protein